jgi:hypothetical protein
MVCAVVPVVAAGEVFSAGVQEVAVAVAVVEVLVDAVVAAGAHPLIAGPAASDIVANHAAVVRPGRGPALAPSASWSSIMGSTVGSSPFRLLCGA